MLPRGIAVFVATLVAFVVLAASIFAFIILYDRFAQENVILSVYNPSEDICSHDLGIKYVQARQILRAREEFESWEFNSAFEISDETIKSMENDHDSTNVLRLSNHSIYHRIVSGEYEPIYRANSFRVNAFYSLSFGIVTVDIPSNGSSKLLRQVSYYRLWKNANDYIRHFLRRYQLHLEDLQQNSSSLMESEFLSTLQNTLLKNKKSYAFTFVRDPIKRFISAYSEIEYRWNETKRIPPRSDFPVFASVGTMERFEEFVASMLRYLSATQEEENDMSPQSLFARGSPYPNLFHAGPMIRTYVLAKNRELQNRGIHLYRFENFSQEWIRLGEALGLKDFDTITARHNNDTSLYLHPSSLDHLNTTISAMRFLAHASNDYYHDFFRRPTPSNTINDDVDVEHSNEFTGDTVSSQKSSQTESNISEHRNHCNFCYRGQRLPRLELSESEFQSIQRRAQRSLRVICRIYLSDFKCLGYDLPRLCGDLSEEWDLDSAAFLDHKTSQEVSFLERSPTLFRLLPQPLLRMMAHVTCSIVSRSPPQCIADVMRSAGHWASETHEEDEPLEGNSGNDDEEL